MSRIPRVPLLRDVLLMEPNGKRIIDSPSPRWFREAHAADDRLVLQAARKLAHGNYDELKAGYAKMARDSEHEREAYEWSEGLIADQANE